MCYEKNLDNISYIFTLWLHIKRHDCMIFKLFISKNVLYNSHMSQVAQMVNIHVFYAFMFFTSMLRGSKIRESEKNITNCNKN